MQLRQVLETVIEISKKAGEYLYGEFKTFNQKDIEVKSLNQLVSYVDITCERLLVEELSKLIPESGFITEEATIKKEADEYNWIIDPLDGTTNFMHGIPVFAISIALTRNGQTVLGVIYDVCHDQMFYADETGAYCNGTKIRVSDNIELNKCLLATGFPYYDFDAMESYMQVLRQLMKHTHGLRRMGSAAIDLAYIAAGKFEAYFEYGLSPWDVAAGAFIVEKAGGRVSDFKGGDQYIYGKEIIATNAHIYDTLYNIVAENFYPETKNAS
ncbi:MAG: inositol monophosphatase [Flavobacteriales bacterium]|nr:inositol monophosphatase [Flavobacteriales bacterium]